MADGVLNNRGNVFAVGMCSSRGITALEFSLALMVMLTFALGVLDVGRYFQVQNAVQQAANVAARCIYPTDGDCLNPGTPSTSQLLEDWYSYTPDWQEARASYTATPQWLDMPVVEFQADAKVLTSVAGTLTGAPHRFRLSQLEVQGTNPYVVMTRGFPAPSPLNAPNSTNTGMVSGRVDFRANYSRGRICRDSSVCQTTYRTPTIVIQPPAAFSDFPWATSRGSFTDCYDRSFDLARRKSCLGIFPWSVGTSRVSIFRQTRFAFQLLGVNSASRSNRRTTVRIGYEWKDNGSNAWKSRQLGGFTFTSGAGATQNSYYRGYEPPPASGVPTIHLGGSFYMQQGHGAGGPGTHPNHSDLQLFWGRPIRFVVNIDGGSDSGAEWRLTGVRGWVPHFERWDNVPSAKSRRELCSLAVTAAATSLPIIDGNSCPNLSAVYPPGPNSPSRFPSDADLTYGPNFTTGSTPPSLEIRAGCLTRSQKNGASNVAGMWNIPVVNGQAGTNSGTVSATMYNLESDPSQPQQCFHSNLQSKDCPANYGVATSTSLTDKCTACPHPDYRNCAGLGNELALTHNEGNLSAKYPSIHASHFPSSGPINQECGTTPPPSMGGRSTSYPQAFWPTPSQLGTYKVWGDPNDKRSNDPRYSCGIDLGIGSEQLGGGNPMGTVPAGSLLTGLHAPPAQCAATWKDDLRQDVFNYYVDNDPQPPNEPIYLPDQNLSQTITYVSLPSGQNPTVMCPQPNPLAPDPATATYLATTPQGAGNIPAICNAAHVYCYSVPKAINQTAAPSGSTANVNAAALEAFKLLQATMSNTQLSCTSPGANAAACCNSGHANCASVDVQAITGSAQVEVNYPMNLIIPSIFNSLSGNSSPPLIVAGISQERLENEYVKR